MSVYIYQLPNWPRFTWKQEQIASVLSDVRHRQGKLIGRMEGLGFNLQAEANLETLTLEVIKTTEIEGEILDAEEVRSSIAQKLGLNIAGVPSSDRHVEGIVEMMIDATNRCEEVLTTDRMFGWHAALFPAGRSGMHKIVTGAWRDNTKDDPMRVVSGAMGKEKIHFEAPEAARLNDEMNQFTNWFNEDVVMDAVIKAAIAHLWFITIHPFDDGNGRIARAIADMQLGRADGTAQRFYSMSAQIRKERKEYYDILETTQKGSLDITGWITWFLQCLGRALAATDQTLGHVLNKARFWEKHTGTSLNARQRLMLNKLLDGFDGKLNTSKWAKIAKTSTDTALRDIQDLIDKQILIKEASGGRSTAYGIQL